jgi:hypothetical protein
MQDNPTNIALKIQNALDDLPLTTAKRSEINGWVLVLHQKASKTEELQSQIDELRTKLKDNGDNI